MLQCFLQLGCKPTRDAGVGRPSGSVLLLDPIRGASLQFLPACLRSFVVTRLVGLPGA